MTQKEHKFQSLLAKAMLKDIAALESMDDPGHSMSLFVCQGFTCDECQLDMGNMDGGCCAGLLRTARTHYEMFNAGRCDKKALACRYATLADWMKRRLLEMPVSFLPPCRWATCGPRGKDQVTWCSNKKCKKYFNGPCSKRCTESEEK